MMGTSLSRPQRNLSVCEELEVVPDTPPPVHFRMCPQPEYESQVQGRYKTSRLPIHLVFRRYVYHTTILQNTAR